MLIRHADVGVRRSALELWVESVQSPVFKSLLLTREILDELVYVGMNDDKVR